MPDKQEPGKLDIWLKIYIGDYLADTSDLTAEQHGAYLLLLFQEWRTGPLPDDLPALCRIAKLSQPRTKHVVMTYILCRFFERTPDGKWIQKRLEAERKQVLEKKAFYKERASKGGQKKAALSRNSGCFKQVLSSPQADTEVRSQNINTENSALSRPKQSEEPISPDMVATAILQTLGLSGNELLAILVDVCRSEINRGQSPDAVRDNLTAAWMDFSTAKSQGKLTQYAPGAKSFFGEAFWKNRESWRWKDGVTPSSATPSPARLSVKEKMLAMGAPLDALEGL